MIGRKEFTKGEKQLSLVETEDTRRVAACGKGNWNGQADTPNVEKPIILVALLHSLDGDITSIHKLVKVCCALCNVCQSVISAD